jgi:hypothetical protein
MPKRCKYCGHIHIENNTYCPGCGLFSDPIEDKSIADDAFWFVLGALLNIFTVVLYALMIKKKPKKAFAMILGLISLMSWYFLIEIINLIFK